jgi:hypothetical protein
VTAEVAIMNQHALVFAADSATTVTHWIKGEKEIRYFKGANKLFQLSNLHPVGMMIFGSASLHSVPWEIIVKDFRKQLASESSESLSGYADRFFKFVENHGVLFPNDLRQKLFADNVMMAAFVNARMVKEDEAITGAADGDKPVRYRERLDALAVTIEATEIPKPLTAEDIEAAVGAYRQVIEGRIRDEIGTEYVLDLNVVPQLAEVSIRATMKRYDLFLGDTGIVIGGYGERDYFPAFEVFRCHGFLDRHFIVLPQEDSAKVDRDKPAVIAPFATTSMINTFRLGISPDVHRHVNEATRKCLLNFARKVAARVEHEGEVPEIQDLVDTALEEHNREWFLPSFSGHYTPMARVIASLPVSEMAALAKSLIELQSLKERVTQPSESVGGPIDVAVISKHDGFIWIERKHYFRPELNPRFFGRQRAATN